MDFLVQSKRNAKAALKLMRKLLKGKTRNSFALTTSMASRRLTAMYLSTSRWPKPFERLLKAAAMPSTKETSPETSWTASTAATGPSARTTWPTSTPTGSSLLVQPIGDATSTNCPPTARGSPHWRLLNILEGFDLANLGHNSAAYLHLLIEAKKLAFADLDAWLADPQYVKIPVASIVSKGYAERQRGRIDLQRAATDVTTGINEPVQWLQDGGDTTYLTVVDNERNVVSFINSLFTGSGIVVPGTGILLQNRGALFSVDPEHPNRIEGRKRPFHTIIPAMVFKDGKPWLSFGVVGGPVQPQGQVQVLLNMIDFGMNVQDAGEAPRFRHDGVADVGLESGGDAAVVSELQAMGHSIVQNPGSFGGYQGIQIDWEEMILLGGSDPRKDGLVAAW